MQSLGSLRPGPPTSTDTSAEARSRCKLYAYARGPLYAKLPARFPPLYEQLLLSYRWAEVDLPSFTLLANSPGEGLSGLRQLVMKEKGLARRPLPIACQGLAGAGVAGAGVGVVDLLKSKLTLGAVRAPSSVLK